MTAQRGRASLQTFHALQASDLAAALNEALQKVRIPPGDYVPELTAPQGPSTAAGVQAMQHLRLVPGQPGQPTLVVGHANRTEGKAELRTFEYIDAVHRERFHRPLVLDREQYDQFLGLAKLVLGALHLETSVIGPPANLAADSPEPSQQRRPWTATIAVVMVFLVLAIAVWSLLGRL
jgi:hypothetical protein